MSELDVPTLAQLVVHFRARGTHRICECGRHKGAWALIEILVLANRQGSLPALEAAVKELSQ